MNLKVNIGNYVLDITAITDNGDVRVKSLFINKISELHNGMKLSEWATKDSISDFVRESMLECNDDTKIVFSKQPRKRLRRFNIV